MLVFTDASLRYGSRNTGHGSRNLVSSRAVRLTPCEQLPTLSESGLKSFRFRSYGCDTIPALVTSLDSALTKRVACNSFRIRSCEKCRVSPTKNSHFGTEHPIRMRVPSERSTGFVPRTLLRGESKDLSFILSNLFLCHTSRISAATPLFATDPKSPSRKSFACHTCDTPREPLEGPFNLCSVLTSLPPYLIASFLQAIDTFSPFLYQLLYAHGLPVSPAVSAARTSNSARRTPCRIPSVQFPRAIIRSFRT